MEWINTLMTHPFEAILAIMLSIATWFLKDLALSVKANSTAMNELRVLIAEKFQTQDGHARDMEKVDQTFGRVWQNLECTNRRIDTITDRMGTK